MDPWVEVVDLGREIREVILTSVEVQSNEAECSLVDRSILANIDAAHEAHVCVEQKCFCASVWVRRRAGALNVGDSYEAVEVCYG